MNTYIPRHPGQSCPSTRSTSIVTSDNNPSAHSPPPHNGARPRWDAVPGPKGRADGVYLSETDLLHFSEHGWVVAVGVVPLPLCERLRGEMDETFSHVTPWQSDNGLQGLSEPHLRSAAFLDLFRVPGLVAACQQLVGHRPRLRHCIALRTTIHPHTALHPDRLADPSTWDWHRDFAPDSIIRHPGTPGTHLTSQAVVVAAYLTTSGAELGATAFLDGTHLRPGTYAELAPTAIVVQPSVSAGSILFFSEALMHAATPVTAARTRDVVLTWMTAPWFGGEAPAPFDIDRCNEPELKSIFAAPHFGDAGP
ncbi:hypothetical protein CH302_01920 [Rhodococcus sp. 15-2388-1-1a]|nr:hypothetical protein CH302_01920 [Rhodococcus sp. 15-2388-1-1a]